MNIVFLVVQQTMFFSIPLLIVALGGMFTERGGVTNIALDGMMIMGAFTSIFFINQMQGSMSGQTLLILAILIAVGTGMVFSLLLAYSAINMKSDQIIGGTALNMFAPAFAIYADQGDSGTGTDHDPDPHLVAHHTGYARHRGEGQLLSGVLVQELLSNHDLGGVSLYHHHGRAL